MMNDHYKTLKIEPLDVMKANMTSEEYSGFLQGNILKYIMRYKYKGQTIEDLNKAKAYIDLLIEFENESIN